MEGGCRDRKTLDRATKLVVEHAKFYIARKRYLHLCVFSTERSELDLLRHCFGGHVYKHRSSAIWMLTRYGELRALYDIMVEYPSFQLELKTKLMISGRDWDLM